MKATLLTQTSLSLILALSLSACQKSDSKSNPGSPAAPAAPTEVTVESPEAQKMTRQEALDAMATIGLQFDESPSLAESELHGEKASWDLGFYRNYVKSMGPKYDIPMQIQVLKNFISASQETLKAYEPSSEIENESFEDLQRAHEKAVIESQVKLAEKRVANLENKLARKQGQVTEPTETPDKVSEPGKS